MLSSNSEPQRVLVTGGTRGIGLATAQKLASAGFEVWVSGRGSGESISSQGHTFHYLQADFAIPEDMTRLCENVRDIGFDALVNNAGINRVAPLLELSEEDFDMVFSVNVRAAFQLTRAVIPKMMDAGYGRICNVSSIWGLKSISGRAAYSTSKFALRGLTAAIASEFAPRGILANCVAPGIIDTELTRLVLGDAGIQEISKRIPIRRLGGANEIAEMIAWLVSANNSYMTGQTVTVDGGFLGA